MVLFIGDLIHPCAPVFYRADGQLELTSGVDSPLTLGSTIRIRYKQKRLRFRKQDTLAECSFSYEQAEKLGTKSEGTNQCLSSSTINSTTLSRT
jgi:hypothetical protein